MARVVNVSCDGHSHVWLFAQLLLLFGGELERVRRVFVEQLAALLIGLAQIVAQPFDRTLPVFGSEAAPHHVAQSAAHAFFL